MIFLFFLTISSLCFIMFFDHDELISKRCRCYEMFVVDNIFLKVFQNRQKVNLASCVMKKLIVQVLLHHLHLLLHLLHIHPTLWIFFGSNCFLFLGFFVLLCFLIYLILCSNYFKLFINSNWNIVLFWCNIQLLIKGIGRLIRKSKINVSLK